MYQLREEGREQSALCQVLFGRVLAPVDVDDVAEALEHVKRYAQRQRETQYPDLRSEDIVDVLEHKACIFDDRKDAEVEYQAERKKQARLFLLGGLVSLFILAGEFFVVF